MSFPALMQMTGDGSGSAELWTASRAVVNETFALFQVTHRMLVVLLGGWWGAALCAYVTGAL